MLWAPIIGGAMTLAGAGLGQSERETIDPEMLKMLFGPAAIGENTNAIFQILRNSPVFSQLMNSASIQGTRMGNEMRGRLGVAGVPGSPMGAFAASAAGGLTGSFQRDALAKLFLQALGIGAQNVAQDKSIWANSKLTQQQTPTFERMLGSSLLSSGSTAFDSWLSGATKKE